METLEKRIEENAINLMDGKEEVSTKEEDTIEEVNSWCSPKTEDLLNKLAMRYLPLLLPFCLGSCFIDMQNGDGGPFGILYYIIVTVTTVSRHPIQCYPTNRVTVLWSCTSRANICLHLFSDWLWR